MRKFVSALMTLGFLAAVAAGPAAAATGKMHSAMHAVKATCGPGMTRVHGYTNKKTGKHVKGYCRKSAMMTKKM